MIFSSEMPFFLGLNSARLPAAAARLTGSGGGALLLVVLSISADLQLNPPPPAAGPVHRYSTHALYA